MGTEAAWVPAVIAAVGAGVQANETDQTARRQDENAAQGIRTQAGKQREADARVSQEVNKLGQSTPEDAQKQATDAFMEQLNRTKTQAVGERSAGATSDAYNTDSAQANADVQKYGANRAGVLGRIAAPGIQRTAENVSRARAGTDLGLIARNSAGDQFLTQLRASQIHNNPWTMAAGQTIGAIGGGMAASGAANGAGNVSSLGKPVARYGNTFTGSTAGFA